MRNLVKVCLALLSTVSACSVLAASAPHYGAGLHSSSRDSQFNIVNYTNNQFMVTHISQSDAYGNESYFPDMTLYSVRNQPGNNIEFDFAWPYAISACFEVDDYYTGAVFIPYACYSSGEIDITYNQLTNKPEIKITR
jgi:hypothetical protein